MKGSYHFQKKLQRIHNYDQESIWYKSTQLTLSLFLPNTKPSKLSTVIFKKEQRKEYCKAQSDSSLAYTVLLVPHTFSLNKTQVAPFAKKRNY